MRRALVIAGLVTFIAIAPAAAAPEGTGGTSPGDNGVTGTTGGAVPANEPLSLGLTGVGLLLASALARRRQRPAA